ncbi:CoaBC [Desulforapulum autotrophicum HRM2]|uniref:Coenzyme A biosynthesis bifunctional protein CoaBC n=1 Tax=Desulforapulum autotrophicum (strain ATCC 43914 / DSM 3382 / VKM B-1955 / HRM2) TaxID=177437 RepID=C0QJ40_DESAH|nr:bifunctional phosphopantothenoylcysteine decarboxylase/phosphopantothenate--cysteine ligase CoaBC [Desulforapulum autotrophicum]ACN15853.1 CoaBC [Desulforapulum autotrophicum HRM2]
MTLKGKNVILGVCGGIAAYKAVELLRRLKKAGAHVQVVMTRAALAFVGETTFRVLSENEVCTGLFNTNESSVRHIEWATAADLVVVAPATANFIGKMAHGIADDALTTMLMAVTVPVVVCPSMNTYMYENLAVQRNLDTLEGDGVSIVEPGTGELACKTTGAGRLPDPALILDRMVAALTKKDLEGIKFLISAGPTREAIDPVRYISNHSSGKMGYAIAAAAEKRGAIVTLVSGPVCLEPPFGVDLINVVSAREMADAVLDCFDGCDVLVKVAAVADYRPCDPQTKKIKKNAQNHNPEHSQQHFTLTLVENPDILRLAGQRKTHQFVVGFAAETNDLEANALIKMEKKNLDMIAGNLVGVEGSGFGSDFNKVKLFFRDGTVRDIPAMEKEDVANHLLDEIRSRRLGKAGMEQ